MELTGLIVLFQKLISGAIARAIYVTGSPLSMLEHPLWKEALHHLNPDYAPPNRKQMSTNLLDSEFNDTKNRIESAISNAKVLHLAADGWSNIRNEGILNIFVFTPRPFFYSFVDTKANRHTAEYLMSEIAKVIDKLGPEKFMSIITDNAANMKRCGKLLEEKYPNVMWNGCLAHTLHLHVSDVLKIKIISEFVLKIIKVIKTIKKSQVLTASFKQIANERDIKVSLHLPVKTRWASYSQCLNAFLISKLVLQNMVVNVSNIDILLARNHKQMILDEEFWHKTKKLRDFLNPITTWITFLEGDYGSVHKVHECFIEINANLDSNEANDILGSTELNNLKEKIKDRRETALKPIHYAACILDPSNKGKALTSSENIDGCEVIMKLAELIDTETSSDVFLELSQYKSQEGLWNKQFINDMATKLEPAAWWNNFFGQTKLGQIANKILTVPSTSAAVERSFSTFGNIHTTKRNKLTTDRAGKLSYVSHNWRLLNAPHKTAKISNRCSIGQLNADIDLLTEPYDRNEDTLSVASCSDPTSWSSDELHTD